MQAKAPGLYHGHRVQQGRDGGGGHRRRGKPAVQRPDGRLDAEAHKGQGKHRQQHGHVAVIARQMAAQGEVHCVVDGQEHQADKRQGRAGDGVDQVLDAGLLGGLGHGLHHQGQGGQGQQLIEQVHGHHIGGESDAQGHAEGGGEEGPEHMQMLLVAHIVEAIEHGKGPQGGRQSGKQPGRAVHAEGDGQPGGKMQQGEGAVVAQEDGQPGQGGGAQDQEAVYQAAGSSRCGWAGNRTAGPTPAAGTPAEGEEFHSYGAPPYRMDPVMCSITGTVMPDSRPRIRLAAANSARDSTSSSSSRTRLRAGKSCPGKKARHSGGNR